MTSLQNADLLTAIVTPFNDQNELDFASLEKLTNHLIAQGSNGFVIGGTTGETPTLSHDEKLELYRHFGQIIDGRFPVIAGTGSNNTQETIDFTNEVAQIDGVDYALVVVPPYNKPNQRGMIAHFTAVADQVNIPIIIYNIPGRTGVKMDAATVVELSHNPNIAGVKQCASLEEMEYIIEHAADDFAIFSGEDAQALTARVLGANGVISVASHCYAQEMRQMYDQLYSGNYQKAAQLQRLLTPKMAALFMYPSPSPVKAVLNAQGYAVGGCRLPILSLNDEEKGALETALELPTGSLNAQDLPDNL
ncbi:4-hydroxy-tetrahydrodipicolinate synthase [Limosilactobacillus sp.]|jgi:4-hydroxy-tetrahydrodipicolinate synthase|uniref:4-hydroxy-tetrahydrodipicolinate synthase n=1 Tax=Limosilactobacillus sp. TaxID=2773925 RepID=UPI0025BDABED|nr:4-hydroxy-tetrahydrodipicolinate synthase [Limosilactobacillus sp.]MCH3922527.1 4-hydroxy-tetrahydrodipicolinate synthase [Limosilactobacillus sp.]MCH3927209.1 4-hydroxy-tetrahydrodipicolinate synthase [Limosilactobacillus sp.]